MYDLVIVGGGIAGLSAALSAPPGARIVVVDKGEAGAGSSPLAQGGLAAAVAPSDSVGLHVRDTLAAGAGLCDEATVTDLCTEGPGAVDWLLERGCEFDRSEDGALDLAREGGQTVSRSVHWRDATGAEIVRALRTAVRERAGDRVSRVAARATHLIVVDGRCVGVQTPEAAFLGRVTLLATGGAGALWGSTTNAPGATGDGIALALEAGAQVSDLEFMQFHPTVLTDGRPQSVLLTEALRGAGARLINEHDERFVDELAPRHVVARAILEQAAVFLDCRDVPALEERFPTVVEGARGRGLDPVTEVLPVFPAAHYFVGGVAADARGRTSVPGLFAAGECASTGMHGANRMAGNSLLEAVVVGRRVGAAIMQEQVPESGARVSFAAVEEIDPRIPDIMWAGAGPIRDEDGLRTALASLATLPASPHRALCLAIVRAARARAESRGVHIRSDYPEPEPAFAVRSFDQAPRPVAD